MKVGFVSLGCSKNLVDTEMAIGLFKSNNFEIVSDVETHAHLLSNLHISINELMSGEELDESRYIKKLEENIITMVNNIETKKKRRLK